MNLRRWLRNLFKCKVGPVAVIATIVTINLVIIYLLQAKPAFQRYTREKLTFINSGKGLSFFSNQTVFEKHNDAHTGTKHQLHPTTGEKNVQTTNIGESRLPVRITADDFRQGVKTGNLLIDDYGKDDGYKVGGHGRGVVLTPQEKQDQERIMQEYRVNTIISDMIPLNRMVPDSRIVGCDILTYPEDLPTVSVIVPFYNEWPSLLLRTVYSVINRSPHKLLKQIVLVDDASTLKSLHQELRNYINAHFPEGLVLLVRLPERKGLINARMKGAALCTGEVLIFFDSHMEVNINWLPPLLAEIARDRKTVTMATLDYIQPDSFEYRYNVNYLTRYGWDWRLVFFETFFRDDQVGPQTTSPRPGPTMVGAAFAIDREYFYELGGYDEGMKVWGGENLEMSWRVWLCGGRLMHIPCSRIGHVARVQPYSFPGGRGHIEHFNYKRAIAVWMGNYTRLIYHTFPDMRSLIVGDLDKRLALKEKLGCKSFSWYLKNVWPELNILDENSNHWGSVKNQASGNCLDNDNYLFQAENPLYLRPCDNQIPNQGFSLTTEGLLRTSLQCVVCRNPAEGANVKLEDCIIGPRDRWQYTEAGHLVHEVSKLCLDVGFEGPALKVCQPNRESQVWQFQPFHLVF